MDKNMKIKMLNLTILALTVVALTACGGVMGKRMGGGQSSSGGDSGGNNDPVVGGDIFGDPNSGAGYGAAVPGTGSLTTPTTDAVVQRIRNGLEGRVNPAAPNNALTNFTRTLANVRSNLPKVTDPLKVTGFDQVGLLAYGACSDLTLPNNNTAGMVANYSIVRAGTITANQAALVNAGIRMLDQHTAGLASNSAAAAGVRASFETLVSQVNVAGNTSTIAFMAVCIAANTAGSSMLGF